MSFEGYEMSSQTRELAIENGIINSIIESIADKLMKYVGFRFSYNGHPFYFKETEYTNPMDFSRITLIYVDVPCYINMDFTCGVTYESTYGRESKTTYMNRSKACMELAKEFVYKVLPKVDFRIKKEVNNKEVEDILEVLE